MTQLCSHLFWSTRGIGEKVDGEDKILIYRDSKRMLGCLQKSLKLADSVMDKDVSVELFISVLELCVWFYDQKAESVRRIV